MQEPHYVNRRRFLSSTTSGFLAASVVSRRLTADDQNGHLPVPLPQQVAWQDCELGMFFHFDIPVYNPGWDWR